MEGQLRRLLTGLLERRLDAEQALAALSAGQPLEQWAAALDHWLTEQLAVSFWSESLKTLAGLQATAPDDKLEIARQSVLTHWDEMRQAQASRDWDTRTVTLKIIVCLLYSNQSVSIRH
jgi:hypothetical protein